MIAWYQKDPQVCFEAKEVLVSRRIFLCWQFFFICNGSNFKIAVKLGDKERFDKEQIGVKEPFPMTNLPFTL